MGDVILTTPIVRCLKNQLDCEIDFLVKENFSPMVRKNPHIKTVHFFQKPVKNNISILMEQNYDLIIDLQKNRKSKSISKLLDVETITFKKLNVKKWILVQTGINLLPEKHLVDRYFESLVTLGVKNDELGNELFFDSDSISSVEKLNLPAKYITLAVGAQHLGKSFNENQLLGIVKESTLPIVMIGGKDEVAISQKVLLESGQDHCIDLVGTTSMLESAEIIKHSKLLISGDTGAMHMASAFKVPQVSVWGCTTPNLGMRPYQASVHSIILEPEEHSHRPCSKLGDKCKYAPNWCIQSIDPARISSAAKTILSKQSF